MPWTGTIEAVVIGASAGGVDALLALLGALPAAYAPPIAIVLHLPREHPSALAEVLEARTGRPTVEAEDKMPIDAATSYVAPPGYHLLIEPERSFALSLDPPVHYSRPAIDLLFESAAEAYGSHLAGILLTGANEDGADGLAHIRQCGGLTLVQDRTEAYMATMPAAGLRHADAEMPLRRLAETLAALARPSRPSLR